MRNYTPHITMDVLFYPYDNWNWYVVVEGTTIWSPVPIIMRIPGGIFPPVRCNSVSPVCFMTPYGLTIIWLYRILTHLTLDTMAAILAHDNFKCISVKEININPNRIPLKFVPMSLNDNNPALLQVMAWRRTGGKPLPEPMLVHFTDAYMWH